MTSAVRRSVWSDPVERRRTLSQCRASPTTGDQRAATSLTKPNWRCFASIKVEPAAVRRRRQTAKVPVRRGEGRRRDPMSPRYRCRQHARSRRVRKLSPERNKAIPTPLRRPSGWYEEDADSTSSRVSPGSGGAGWPDFARPRCGLRWSPGQDWFPDEFEQATGVRRSRSGCRAGKEDAWRAAHADREIGVGAIFADGDRSMVEVTLSPAAATGPVRPASSGCRPLSTTADPLQPSVRRVPALLLRPPPGRRLSEVVRAPKPPPAPKPATGA